MTCERRGVFVTVDGPGGAGKSTVVVHLARYLTERGHSVHATTEPSRGVLGDIARHQANTYQGRALACLVAADRYDHLAKEIRPALAVGQIVVCDRYVPSSYVLQRMDGVPLSFIEAVNMDADRPDLTVILTVDPEIAAGRIARRGAHSRFEGGVIASQAEADLYQDAIDRLTESGYTLLTIDTTDTRSETVADQIGSRITGLLGRRGPAGTTG